MLIATLQPDVASADAPSKFLNQLRCTILNANSLQFLASIGIAIARGLGFEPGSRLSSYTQLYTAFILSGLLHMLGDAMIDMRYLGLSFPFFLSQAVAITFEDAAIGVARRVGVRGASTYLARAVGYTWVFI